MDWIPLAVLIVGVSTIIITALNNTRVASSDRVQELRRERDDAENRYDRIIDDIDRMTAERDRFRDLSDNYARQLSVSQSEVSRLYRENESLRRHHDA